MVTRFCLLSVYSTWWHWAVYCCPFSVIKVNQNVYKKTWMDVVFREMTIFMKLMHFQVRFLYTFSSIIFHFGNVCQTRL